MGGDTYNKRFTNDYPISYVVPDMKIGAGNN